MLIKEVPMIYVTPDGLKVLREKLAEEERRLAAIREEKAVAYTASGDTWHDNPGFNQLEQAELRKARDIVDMRRLLASAVLREVEPRDLERASLGSIVLCSRSSPGGGDSEKVLFEIVGFGEGDPRAGKLPYYSPVGGALLGLEPGESRLVETPLGKVEYEVVELYPDWETASGSGAKRGTGN